jgi:O-antigen/teichoic acid export membrane protein
MSLGSDVQIAESYSLEVNGSLLARNTLLNFLCAIGPTVVGIATIPYVVRGLGVERYGILSLVWVLAGYFGFFNLGLDDATNKFVAEHLGRGEVGRVPSLLWTSLSASVVLGVLGGIAIAAATPVLAGHALKQSANVVGETRGVFAILAVGFPVLFATGTVRGAVAAAQRFDLINLVDLPMNVANFLIPAVAVWMGFGLKPIVAFVMLSRLATLFIYLMYCFRIYPNLGQGAFRFERQLLHSLLRFGGWVSVTSIVGPILSTFDRFLIGARVSVTAVGYYTPPFSVVSRLGVFPTALVTTLFPAFSSRAGDKPWVRNACVRSVKYLLLLLGPGALFLIFFSHDLLALWLGREFARQSTVVMRILTVGVLVNLLTYVPFHLLRGVGRPDLTAKFHLLELPIHAAIAWYLMGRMGLPGAALAFSIRVVLDAVLVFGAVAVLDWVPLRSFVHYGLLPCLGALATLALAFFAVAIWSHTLLSRMILTVTLGLVFVPGAWFLALDGEEKQYLWGLGRCLLRRITPAASHA